jgi:CRP/FNR family cyclic AMP-dependent transcriptional regulator
VHSSEHVLAELGKGDFFGEMAIVINDKRFATAIAITKVELLAFTSDDLANLITKNPKVAFNIIEKLCRRLQNANLNIKYLLNIGKIGLTALVLLDSFACEEGSVGIPLEKVREELIRKLKVPRNLISHYLDFFATDHSIDIRDDALFIGNRAKLEKHVENAFLQD